MSDLEVKERVFTPGNLVHGTWRTYNGLPSYFNKGIRPGEAVGNGFYTPELVCFGMLGTQELAERYLKTSHYGPKWENEHYSADYGKIAFIVSREKVLAAYSGQIFAVGPNFWNQSFWNRIRYGRELGFSIHDIPVKHPGGNTVLKDEVRIYPSTKPNLQRMIIVPPDAYVGLVALPHRADDFIKRINGSGVRTSLPVFSPQADLLGYTGERNF